ncbi:MAG: hypothetical protein V5B36_11655 [Candidatus Accumulibacter sp. UW25]|jgi:hypothetical protein
MFKTIDFILFVVRQSPDWNALSTEHEAGFFIDPSRYTPGEFIKGFPDHVENYINMWNLIFPINFFRCRKILKDIAFRQISSVKHSIVLQLDDLPHISSRFATNSFVLFFVDDDDWFAPNTFQRLSGIDFANSIAVFPLVRFESNSFTFVRDTEQARMLVGERRNFNFRYQTNNYAIPHPLATSEHLPELKDHVAASQHACMQGFDDSYHDIIISATNKTPASASIFRRFLTPDDYRVAVTEYVDKVSNLFIPDEMEWAKTPVKETLDLFKSLID